MPRRKDRRNLIYALTDPRDGVIRYIGKSVDGMNRPLHHAKESELNHAPNTHKTRWIRQLKAIGLSYAILIVEELQEASLLNERERWWISLARAWGCQLTNATDGGEGTYGWHPSPETIAKNSAAHKGIRLSQEVRAAIARGHIGLKKSAETKEKIGAAHRGRKKSPEQVAKMRARRGTALPETRAKISAAKKGKPLSATHRAHMSAAQKGRPGRTMSDEHKAKLRSANLGRSLSPEHRAKLSAAHRGKAWSEQRQRRVSEAWVKKHVLARVTPPSMRLNLLGTATQNDLRARDDARKHSLKQEQKFRRIVRLRNRTVSEHTRTKLRDYQVRKWANLRSLRFLGTPRRERIVRGDAHYSRVHPEKLQRGEARPAAKLTEDKVREIRRRYPSEIGSELAKEFGISTTCISGIVRGLRWKHVAN